MPGVEVLAVELAGPDRFTVFIDHPERGRPRALRARHRRAARLPREYAIDVSLARARAAAAQARALPQRRRPQGRPPHAATRKNASAARSSAPASAPSPSQAGDEHVEIPYDAIVRGNLIRTTREGRDR